MPAISHASLFQADLASLLTVTGQAGCPVNVAPHLFYEALESGATVAGLRSLCDDVGATVRAIDPLRRGLPGPPATDPGSTPLARFFRHGEEDCYRAADAFGAGMIYLSHFLGTPAPLTAMVDAIGAIALRARRYGLSLAIEFIPGTAIPDLATAVAISAQAELGLSAIIVDLWHLLRAGDGVHVIDALPRGVIHAVQLCDGPASVIGAPPTSMAERLLPGAGDFPIDATLAAIRRNSPGVELEIEVINASLQRLRAEDALQRMLSACTRFSSGTQNERP